MIDLNPNHLATVEGILVEHLPGVEVRAFGSRVTWTAKDYSDLDLAVVGGGPLDVGTLGRLKEAFQESDLPMRVDVLDWHAISQSFRNVIEQEYVVVQQGNGMRRAVTSDRWRETTLGDCVVINEDTYSPKEAWPFVNYLDTGNITENRIADIQHLVAGRDKIPSRARRKVQPGDIVYSTVRPNQKHFGMIENVPENFLASTGFAVMRAKESLADTDFLYWFLTQGHIVEYLHSIAENSTSAYPSIRPSDIGQLTLLLPSLAEQRAIAHVLGTLDDKIELNRRMSETLEEMARAVFKSWFVDFDPVRAKLEGRDTGLPPDMAALFPDRLVDSELGPIPQGWEVKPLGEVVELAYGKALKAGDRKGGSIPVYGSNGQVGWHNEKLMDGPGIVVGRKGNPGVAVWVHSDFFPIDTAFYVVPKKCDQKLHFLFFALAAQDLPSVAADSAVPGLNRNLAYMSRQLLPDDMIVETFNDCVKTLFTRRLHLEEESRTLAALRDALLPKLVSGEVRVGHHSRTLHGAIC